MNSVLASWLGEGGVPVAQELAEARAKICEGCDRNVEPKWWERMVKDPIAFVIRCTLEIKEARNLKVPNEDKLMMCRACGCCNPLHIWSPLKHIRNHTGMETYPKFSPQCWILNERE